MNSLAGDKNVGVVFPEVGKVELQERQLPEVGPDQVLILTRRTVISAGTELTILSGDFPQGSAWARYGQFPFAAGYCAAGEVVGVGSDVYSLRVGDVVAAPTPHVKYAAVAAGSTITAGGRSVALEHLPFVTFAQIVMNAVRRSNVRWGESVVVFGLGVLGQLAVRFCRIVGAWPVVGVDPLADRRDRLPDDPAVVTVDPTSRAVPEAVAEATRGRMADVVFEVTGVPSLIPDEFAVLKPHDGRVVLLSSPRGPTSFDFHDLCNSPSHTIIGAHNSSHPEVESSCNPWTKERNGELFLDLVAAGEVDVGPLITNRLPYTEAPRVYRELLTGRSKALAVVLDWDEPADAREAQAQ